MIFSEIYGTYYNTVAKIIQKALNENLSADALYSCIIQNAFTESVVPITDAINKEKWQLLTFNREKNLYTSVIKNEPKLPLTKLQLSYLKALLFDKRIRLFDLDFDYFEKMLIDVEPLWQNGDYEVFDKYCDGDDFLDANYKKRFRMIVEAKEKSLPLDFTLKNRHGKDFCVTGIPEKIEYSEKDDKFRIILKGKNEVNTINIARIVSLKFSSNSSKKTYSNFADFNTDTIVLELTDERNALERVSMHFSNLKKRTTKIEENKYRMELEFSRDDETEMVIRLLQFGPVIKVLEPSYVVAEITRRIGMQLRLLSQ